MNLFDIAVYAPIGAVLTVKERGPVLVDMFVARGKAEVQTKRASLDSTVTTVRSHGVVAWHMGLPKLQARTQRHLDALLDRFTGAGEPTPEPAPESAAPMPAPAPEPAPPAPAPFVMSAPTNGHDGASASSNDDDLPIPGYDALSASQVVERLLGLEPEELEAVRTYEATHRNRRTILGKIEQLAS